MLLNPWWVEAIGYSGSFLVALSLSMKSISRLRKINLLGASTFALYGLLVHAYPVFVLNGFIALVDVYYLLQMRRQQDYFELLPINTNDSPFLRRFLEFHQQEIQRFFPDFKFDRNKSYRIAFVLRNLLPVNLFIAEKTEPGVLEIHLDYSIPAYRDLQNAHYLFQRGLDFFKNEKIHTLRTCSVVSEHQKYLKRMAFQQLTTSGPNCFELKLGDRSR